jgi:hypothetical protein
MLASDSRPDIATIDLQDAIDRVSLSLVEYLFGGTKLIKPLKALRTPMSVLPSGEVVHLRKYAAMGSALCFPIEALCFYSLLEGITFFADDYKPVMYVYGDDIIMQTKHLDLLLHCFTSLGLRVNEDKCCYTGFFRESCGGEFFKGQEVTYIKTRVDNASTLNEQVSLVELSNSLFERAYYRASEYIRNFVSKTAKFRIPFGYRDSGYLNFNTIRMPKSSPSRKRWSKRLQQFQYLRPVVSGSKYNFVPNTIDEEYAEYYRKMTQGWSPDFVSGVYANRRRLKVNFRFVDAAR